MLLQQLHILGFGAELFVTLGVVVGVLEKRQQLQVEPFDCPALL